VVLPAVAETLDPLHKLRRGLLRTGEKKPITKIRAYFVTDSVRELLNTHSYAEIFKDISTVQTRNAIKNTDFRQHETLPTAETETAIDQSWVGHLYYTQYG
jgi:hypothetical protein